MQPPAERKGRKINGAATVLNNEPERAGNAAIENRRLFQRLVAAWHDERSVNSSLMTEMAVCPSYQQIIGMGRDALPLILERLIDEGEEPDHWFWALKSIARADPVAEEDRGDIVMMAEAWLRWGEDKGYVCQA
jgi:hypothetical protein